MTTVTLLRHKSGFVNVDDGFVVCRPDDSYNPYRQEINEYELPDGYSVHESNLGELMIYDHFGEHCEIIQHRATGRPQLIGREIGKTLELIRTVAA